MLQPIFSALIARTNAQRRVDALRWVQRPIVNHLRIAMLLILIRRELLAIDEQIHLGSVHRDGVVMPLIIAHLRYLPAPFGRREDVQIAIVVVLSDEQDQSTVSDKQCKVMTIHFVAISRADDMLLGQFIVLDDAVMSKDSLERERMSGEVLHVDDILRHDGSI